MGDLEIDVDPIEEDITDNEDESSVALGDYYKYNLGNIDIPALLESKTGYANNLSKRRKIVIDNNQTELTSEQMKAMLRDTSDIVMQNVQHLAAWPRDDVDEEEDAHLGICPALQRLSAEQLLARPCIGDDGGLAPELLALWGRNMCKITGKAGTQLPFRMRGKQGEKQRGAMAEKIMEQEAAEERENARSQQVVEEEEDIQFGGGDHDVDFGGTEEQRRGEDDEYETPFDIQDEFGSAEYKNDNLEDEDELSVQSDRSSFSLGAVNDLEKELYQIGDEGAEGDQPRQVLGDELVSHTSKWHKHTIRVLGMLKRNMNNEDEPDEEPKLSYNKLSSGCSRRTAAGVFFEILQLKTWDFVELNQEKSYGDISITPGLRFDEPPPSASN